MKFDHRKEQGAAEKVASCDGVPAEIVGGKWDGLEIQVPVHYPLRITLDSARLDALADHPVDPARAVAFRALPATSGGYPGRRLYTEENV